LGIRHQLAETVPEEAHRLTADADTAFQPQIIDPRGDSGWRIDAATAQRMTSGKLLK